MRLAITICFLIYLPFCNAKNNSDLDLSLPINCDYGKNCFIQNYFDLGNSSINKYQDYKCGEMTYIEHNGTDFRVLDYFQMKQLIEIRAAQDGIVKAVRDFEPEFIYLSTNSIASLNSKECGNGVVISHDNNYETQYCHMKKGSINVTNNQKINRGDVIGYVGMSGQSEFPHLHLTVRRNGIPIDPFSNQQRNKNSSYNCDKNNLLNSLWDIKTKNLLNYIPTAILNFNVTNKIPDKFNARMGKYRAKNINIKSDKLILWADLMGMQKDDEVIFKLKDNNNKVIFNSSNLIKERYAQYFIYTGKNITSLKLRPQSYNAIIEIIRANQKILTEQKRIIIDAEEN